jgi:hypothetical protein
MSTPPRSRRGLIVPMDRPEPPPPKPAYEGGETEEAARSRRMAVHGAANAIRRRRAGQAWEAVR